MKKCSLLVMILLASICFSQDGSFILGQLQDEATEEPIPFATIKLKGKALGVVTNIDGGFKIPFKYWRLGNVIEISCMGYESKEIDISDLLKDSKNVIVLKPSLFELAEAVVSANVKKLSAREIVKKAVANMPRNYPQKPFGLVGYYRDYQIKNGKYVNLNEAVVKVFDGGFGLKDNFNNQYELYSYTKNTDFESDWFAKQPYNYKSRNKIVPNARLENDGGNEFFTLSLHDAIRNYGRESFSFVDYLTTDFVENHRFRFRGKTSFKNERVYEIDFSLENTGYTAEGKIFIGINDFAIFKLDYFTFRKRKPKDTNNAVNQFDRYSNGFEKMNRELIYHIQTEYTRGHDNELFLNFISFYNKMLIRRPRGFNSKFTIHLNDSLFRIQVNKVPVELEKIKPSDFRIRYKDKRVPIKDFYFMEDERTFVVIPHLEYRKTKSLLTEIFKERDSLQVADIRYDYRGIKDSLGNKLDERQLEYVHQYREFFVQEVLPESGTIENMDNLMIKELPLEHKKQPISDGQMKKEYWKNTPLPKFEK